MGDYQLDIDSATNFKIDTNGSFSQLFVADATGGLAYKYMIILYFTQDIRTQ
jgi:hypothetical protein